MSLENRRGTEIQFEIQKAVISRYSGTIASSAPTLNMASGNFEEKNNKKDGSDDEDRNRLKLLAATPCFGSIGSPRSPWMGRYRHLYVKNKRK
jgi:hypothetical protein